MVLRADETQLLNVRKGDAHLFIRLQIAQREAHDVTKILFDLGKCHRVPLHFLQKELLFSCLSFFDAPFDQIAVHFRSKRVEATIWRYGKEILAVDG